MIDSDPDPSLSPDPDPAFYRHPFLSETKWNEAAVPGWIFLKNTSKNFKLNFVLVLVRIKNEMS